MIFAFKQAELFGRFARKRGVVGEQPGAFPRRQIVVPTTRPYSRKQIPTAKLTAQSQHLGPIAIMNMQVNHRKTVREGRACFAESALVGIRVRFACAMRWHVRGHVIAANRELPDYVFATHLLLYADALGAERDAFGQVVGVEIVLVILFGFGGRDDDGLGFALFAECVLERGEDGARHGERDVADGTGVRGGTRRGTAR